MNAKDVIPSKALYFEKVDVFKSKVNSSVRKIYILRPNGDQVRKMQLEGLRLGIEPATELQKPLPSAWVRVLYIYIYIYIYVIYTT